MAENDQENIAPESIQENRIAEQSPAIAAVSSEVLEKSFGVLRDLLQKYEGCIGVVRYKKELESAGFTDPSDLVEQIRIDGQSVTPPIFHAGRSFFTKEVYEKRQHKIDEAAECAAAETPTAEDKEEEAEVSPKRKTENKQEEARLVRYVVETLTDIYDSAEYTPEVECAFDVHAGRAGGDFENVDAIAVDWRDQDTAEVIVVEVKLGFTSKLVQQANNYRRFSDRVWIAVPISGSLPTAARELRKIDPYLFDYVIESGLGILACRRTVGSRYEVLPVHWPRLLLQGDRESLDKLWGASHLAAVTPLA